VAGTLGGGYARGMSQFSQDAYQPESGYITEPDRTSALAILSLVCSLVCCIPGLPALGALLGVGGAVGIKMSGGRVGGIGLAIAGIVIGAIITVGQVGVALGFFGGLQEMRSQIDEVMLAAESGDAPAVRAFLVPPADAELTDADVERFRSEFGSLMGGYIGVPSGLELFRAYQTLGSAMQPGGAWMSSNNEIPFPAEFDNGVAMIILSVDQTGAPPPPDKALPLLNIRVVTMSGDEVSLRTLGTSGTLGSSGATPDASSATTPETVPGAVDDPAGGSSEPAEDDGP